MEGFKQSKEKLPDTVQAALADFISLMATDHADSEYTLEQEGNTCYIHITDGTITGGEMANILGKLRFIHGSIQCYVGDDGEIVLTPREQTPTLH